MSISQNFPEEGPTLNLNFAGSKVLDPRITFSRSSVGTYMDANGLIVTAAADEPRFDHRYVNGEIESLGLLVEEQRTNLVTYSDDLSQWSSNGGSLSSNDTTAPDGTVTADKLTETSGVFNGRYNGGTITLSTSTTYSIASFIKPVDQPRTRFGIFSGSDWYAYVDTDWDSNGSPTTNSSPGASNVKYESYPNGWYRASFIFTSPSSVTATQQYHQHPDRTASGKSAWFWGAQLEAGEFPTSYIPTSSSQATRSPDSVSMTGTNFSDWYNQSEGTVYADTRMVGVQTGRYDRLWAITNSNLNLEGISVFVAGPAGFQGGYVSSVTITNSATEQVSGTIDVSAITTPKLKSAFAFKQNDCASGYNGDLKFVDNTVDLSTFTTSPDRLLIGQPQRYQGYSCMTISQLTYYPRRLTNSQLQTLTK